MRMELGKGSVYCSNNFTVLRLLRLEVLVAASAAAFNLLTQFRSRVVEGAHMRVIGELT